MPKKKSKGKHLHCSCYTNSIPQDHYLALPGHCCFCRENNLDTENGRILEKNGYNAKHLLP